MRVRDHIALSTAAAALMFPLVGKHVAPAWAASILIDSDHYFWFVKNERRVHPLAAVRFFNEAQPAPTSNVRWFHSPVALTAVAALAAWRRSLFPVAVGMAAHVVVDTYHDARMKRVRDAVLHRDAYRCQECGAKDDTVTVHTRRQPMLLPSYEPRNFVALCGRCHEAAHRARPRPERAHEVRAARRRA